MSTENQPMPEILIEWLGKKKRRAVGVQTWNTPIRKNKMGLIGADGRFAPDNVILDCSIPSNRLTFNGSSVQILSTDPEEKKQAILQLAGYGDPKGDVWGVLKEGDSRQLYRVTKIAEQEANRIKIAEEKIEYQTRIFAMKDEELREYALLLGIQGSIALIKHTLGVVYFEDSNKALKNTLVHYMDMEEEERMLTVSLLSAVKLGNPNLKQGVHQRSTGLYYNDRRLGIDVKDAIYEILKSPDKVELVTAIKGYTASSEKIEKPKKTK